MKPQYLAVDTAALLTHIPLWEYGETLCSVPEVIAEIRDKEARRRVEALPFPITMRQPLPQSIKFVNEFSKKTGDYASLSLADIKILALTYELEVEVQGSADHLNTEPRKIITEVASNRRRGCTEKFNDPPEECGVGQESLTNSTTREEAETEPSAPLEPLASPSITKHHLKSLNSFLCHYSYINGYVLSRTDINLYKALIRHYPQLCTTGGELRKPPGTDTSSGSPLSPPCSPLTHTLPHVRRWAVHITSITEAEEAALPRSDEAMEDVLSNLVDETKGEEEKSVTVEADTDHQTGPYSHHTETTERQEEAEETWQANESGFNEITQIGEEAQEDKRINEGEEKEAENSEEKQEDGDNSEEEEEEDDDDGWITCKNIKKHKARKNFFSAPEEDEEEEKDVKVACITGDFAVQNVLKHIGLSVMGVDGKLIKRLKTYILRCYACFKTTSIMEKIFCPHCGNKTLKKVSVTVDPDGTQRIWINTKKPINKKGMKYSLPMPKGGKHGRNPILVEDQREAKRFSSKMSKKKINPLHEDYNPADQTPFAVRDVYSRAAQLGYIGGKNHYHFYWERRNPNQPLKKTGKK